MNEKATQEVSIAPTETKLGTNYETAVFTTEMPLRTRSETSIESVNKTATKNVSETGFKTTTNTTTGTFTETNEVGHKAAIAFETEFETVAEITTETSTHIATETEIKTMTVTSTDSATAIALTSIEITDQNDITNTSGKVNATESTTETIIGSAAQKTTAAEARTATETFFEIKNKRVPEKAIETTAKIATVTAFNTTNATATEIVFETSPNFAAETGINAVIETSTAKSTNTVAEMQSKSPEEATKSVTETVPIPTTQTTTTQTTTETIIENMIETTTETTVPLITTEASDTTAQILADTVTPYRTENSTSSSNITLSYMDTVISQTLSQNDLPLVYLNGSIQTYQNYYAEFASKTSTKYLNFKNAIEVEMKSILESNSLIENAKVSVTKINTDNSKIRRNSAKAAVDFVSICSVRVSTEISPEMLSEIEFALTANLTIDDTNSSTLLDKESISTLRISVEKPRIIEFESLTKTEISERIGLIMIFFN